MCYRNNSCGQTDVGDLKLPRFVQNAKGKGMLKKKKKSFICVGFTFYKTGQLDAIFTFHHLFTDGQKSVDTENTGS